MHVPPLPLSVIPFSYLLHKIVVGKVLIILMWTTAKATSRFLFLSHASILHILIIVFINLTVIAVYFDCYCFVSCGRVSVCRTVQIVVNHNTTANGFESEKQLLSTTRILPLHSFNLFLPSLLPSDPMLLTLPSPLLIHATTKHIKGFHAL